MNAPTTRPEGPDRPNAKTGSAAQDRPRCVVEGPVHSTGWSWFFTIAAAAVFAQAASAACTAPGSGSQQPGFAFYAAWPLLTLFTYLARRLRARGAVDVLLNDPRAPVFYLRTFAIDRVELALAQPESGYATEETRLVEELDRIGPVVAIGRPGEKLAHLGAARLYVSDDDWQNVASRLMASARLVVIRAGAGAGLQWELACARETLPGDRAVIWFPGKFSAAAYAAFREGARRALKTDLFEEPPNTGYIRFDLNWQAQWAASLNDIPDTPRGQPVPLEPSREQQRPDSTTERSGAEPPALRELLARCDVQATPPPRFGLHPVAWAVAALWLVLLWGRAWYFSDTSGSGGHLAAAALETTYGVLIALGLAFIPYVHNPARRLLPSLALCTVLIADASWIVARTVPSKAEAQEVLLSLETQVCRKAFACSSPSDVDGLVAECIKEQMEGTTGAAGAVRFYIHQTAWGKCEQLDCADFAKCFEREAGLLALPADEHQRLVTLVCEAIQGASRPDPSAIEGQATSKWTELEQTLEGLQNPALAEALIEEGRLNCDVAGGREPGEVDRTPK